MKKILLTFLTSLLLFAGCDSGEVVKQPELPTVVTADIGDIKTTTALGGGDVTSDGNSPVTERGICWGTASSPTTANNTSSNGSGTGKFTAGISALSSGTQYRVRAYATNAVGTAYGNEVTFTASVELVDIVLSTPKASIAKGLTAQFTATGKYSDNSSKDISASVTWLSANPGIVSASSSTGAFLATGVGTTGVTALFGSFAKSMNITVTVAELVSIAINTENVKITPLTSQPVTAIGTYTDASTKNISDDVEWSTSVSVVANVSANGDAGVINASDFGTTTVKARWGAISGTLDITVTVVVGKEYGGGYVFYVDDTGRHGLTAAKTDVSSGVVFWVGTWTYKDEPSYSPSEAVGAGKANMDLIIAQQGNAVNAARLCFDLVQNGHDDWVLPSSGDLQLMCQNLYKKGIGGLSSGFYWSSTDTNKIHNATWMQFDGCYVRTDLGRDMENRVRPVRSF